MGLIPKNSGHSSPSQSLTSGMQLMHSTLNPTHVYTQKGELFPTISKMSWILGMDAKRI